VFVGAGGPHDFAPSFGSLPRTSRGYHSLKFTGEYRYGGASHVAFTCGFLPGPKAPLPDSVHSTGSIGVPPAQER